MRSPAHNLAVLIALLATSSSSGTDLVLRERATQHGTVIRLGDIANIAASSSAELQSLASTPLLPAPAVGTQQFLTAADVRQLLIAHGMLPSHLTIRGAKVVEIGTPTVLPSLPSTATQSLASPLTRQEVESHVEQAIMRYLQKSPSESRWRVDVSLREDQVLAVTSLAEELQVRGRSQPRSGREQFFLRVGNSPQEFSVTAVITQLQSVVVVKQAIQRGQLIRAADMEIREQEGNLPTGTFTDLQQVVGKEAQRALRPDRIVRRSDIRAALIVRRGETVVVFVRTGGVSVRTRAIAKADGALGELVTLETLEGKQRLDASVSGPGEVTIYATGGRASDYASLSRGTSRRR